MCHLSGMEKAVMLSILSLHCPLKADSSLARFVDYVHPVRSGSTATGVTGALKHECTLALLCIKACFSLLQAQAVALTVAQAFTLAFEIWQVAKEGNHHILLPLQRSTTPHR